MAKLTPREKELVAIGASIGSNCIPCIKFHIPAALRVGIDKNELVQAIELANTVKQAPAKEVLETAIKLASAAPQNPAGGSTGGCACGGAC